MQEIYGNESVDGAVFYWGRDDESPTIFTQEAIRKACFEEVNHSVDEDEEYEKAFRYRLRELVCQNSIKNRVAKIRKWMYDLSGTNLNEVETIYKWKSEI